MNNSSFLQVPLLNLLANIQERAGGVVIRIGGNTQEFAALVDSLPDGHTFNKTEIFSTQTVSTALTCILKSLNLPVALRLTSD
jgi:hypothetical protein